MSTNNFRKAELAKRANQVAWVSQYGSIAPWLREFSSRERVCAWMQWSDHNGCHTDELAIAEDFDPYTEDEAWEALDAMLKENI